MQADSLPEALVELLAAARAVAVLTGSGVSAESGIPTFRDALTGHWARFDPYELATPQAFGRDPARVTEWYDQRRLACLQCRPNAGHAALTEIEGHVEERGGRFLLVTQNVDGLHQRAGSRRIVELHGSLHDWRCSGCAASMPLGDEPLSPYPPRCRACGQPVRPGVVWFGEMLPRDAFAAAESMVQQADLLLVVGTSGLVHPAAGLVDLAMDSGCACCQINLEPTPYTSCMRWCLQGAAGTILPSLVRKTWGDSSPA